MGDIFYQNNFNIIGGVETFLYELVKKYSDRDLTIYYSFGDSEQIKRIKKYARCKRYIGEKIKCDRAFFNYDINIIDNVEAKEYIQIIHADFKDKSVKHLPLIQSDKINKYYAVSENNRKSFIEITGKDCGVAYNPITIDKPDKIMHLISAQRLSSEKGGQRIEEMVKMLDASGINYEWKIFSNQRLNINSDNVIYKEPTLDIRKHIADSDYMALLSDTEGFCYGLYESLLLGVPVIATNIPIIDELGIIDGENGYVIDFDLSNLDLNKIYASAGKLKFNYEPKEDIWGSLLTKDKSDYFERLNMKYRVKATNKYKELNIVDIELKKIPEEGELFEVTGKRLEVLTGDNPYNAVFAEVVEEIKQKAKKATKKKNE